MDRPQHEYETDIKLLTECPPTMWLSEIAVILEQITKQCKNNNNSISILEWGSGNSTIFYPCYLLNKNIDFRWTSIEHFVPWYHKVVGLLEQNGLTSCVDYYLVDPTNVDDKEVQRNMKLDKYINYPLSLGCKFDIVLVDGRKRKSCLEVASKIVNPDGGVVFLHDAERPWYHDGFQFYKDHGVFVSSNFCKHAWGNVQKLWKGEIK